MTDNFMFGGESDTYITINGHIVKISPHHKNSPKAQISVTNCNGMSELPAIVRDMEIKYNGREHNSTDCIVVTPVELIDILQWCQYNKSMK